MQALWEVLSASLGVLLLVVGFLIRAVRGEAESNAHPYDLIPDVLGIVLFLVSILFYLYKLLKIAEESSSGIGELSTKIDQIKSGFEREPLFATIRPVIASMKSIPDDYIFSSFASTLEHIARHCLEVNAEELNLAHQNRESRH
jgi:hypothetical protein